MIFTETPKVDPGLTLNDLPGTFSDALSASARSALYNSPVSQLSRTWDDKFNAGGELLDYETARSKAKAAGVDVRIDPNGMTEGALNLLIERKRFQARTADALARGPHGFFAGSAYFLTGLGAAMIDPINLASAFIPVARIIGMTNDLALAGRLGAAGAAFTASGRLAARARVGAVEGAVGQALLEPMTAYRARQEQEDYGITDTLLNVGFGAVLGATAHAGLGALGDRAVASARGETAKALINDAKTAGERARTVEAQPVFNKDSAAAKLQAADLETVSATFRAEVALAADGRKMDTGVLVGEPAKPATELVSEIPDMKIGDSQKFKLRDGTEVVVEKQLDKAAGTAFAPGYTPKDSDYGAIFVAKTSDGEQIGRLAYFPGDKAIESEVSELFRRKGIGTLLYDLAEKHGADFSGDPTKLGTISEDALALRAYRDARAQGDVMGGAKLIRQAVSPAKAADPIKVQQAAAASHLPENDVHFDAQAKAEVDQAMAAQGAEVDPAQAVNRALQDAQAELAAVSKQLGVDIENNGAMRSADEVASTASRYAKAVEEYVACRSRT